jgi:drug/metabolite transporter (DMT)-like permease
MLMMWHLLMMPHSAFMQIHSLTAEQRASAASIATLCTIMYGSIGAAWLVYLRMPEKSASRESMKLALLCVSWCSTSIGMHILNKAVMSVLPTPELISIFQMAMAVLAVGPFAIKSLLETEWRQLKFWLLVPAFFAGMLCSSFYTFTYISLSLLTLIRTLTPVVVLPIERMLMPPEKVPALTTGLVLSLLVVLTGAMIYVGGLKDVSVTGLVFALSNMILAAADRLIQRRFLTNECQGIDSKVCTLLNNLFGMVPLFVLAQANGQLQSLMNGEHLDVWLDPNVMAILIMSGVIGIGICYIGFECQRALSATSFFVMQNLSRVGVIIAGVVFFGDPIKSVTSIIGMVVTLSGGAAYGRLQMLEQQKQEQERKKLLA